MSRETDNIMRRVSEAEAERVKQGAAIDPDKVVRHELTSNEVRHLAGEGLRNPKTLTPHNVQQLAGSVLRHLEHHDKANSRPTKSEELLKKMAEED